MLLKSKKSLVKQFKGGILNGFINRKDGDCNWSEQWNR